MTVDGELELVLADADGRTLIAAVPDSACHTLGGSFPRAPMAAAFGEIIAACGEPAFGEARSVDADGRVGGVGFINPRTRPSGAPNRLGLPGGRLRDRGCRAA